MMTIKIRGKLISKENLLRWKQGRIAKVAQILKIQNLSSPNADEANARLTEIKLGYSYDGIYKLLKSKLNFGAFVMRGLIALSGKKRRFAVTEISVEGLSSAEMIHQLDRFMLEPSRENDRINLSACPDHYVLRPLGGKRLEVIETTGNSPVPVQFFIVYGDETGLHTPRDPSYPQQSAGAARFEDGTVLGGVRHQFKDTPKGFEARLVVEFPALTPGFMVRAHEMHLACEFSHWFQIIKDLKSGKI